MKRTMQLTLGGVVAAALVIGLATGVIVTQPLRARMEPPLMTMQGEPITHEAMRSMVDLMHGAGTSQRIHEAMGEDAEAMMKQCAAMMAMMPDMMGGQNNQTRPDMIDWMMRRS